MNNMIIIILSIVMVLSIILSIITFMLSAFDEGEKLLHMSFKFIGLTIICIIVLLCYMIEHPQPTFREVCEANNGTYIANTGRTGDSCIYNKRGEDHE